MCLTAQELVPNLYECCNHTGMCTTKPNNININQVNHRPIETPPLHAGAFGWSTYIPRSTYHRLTYFRISRSARVKSSPHHEQRSTHLKSSPRSPITDPPVAEIKSSLCLSQGCSYIKQPYHALPGNPSCSKRCEIPRLDLDSRHRPSHERCRQG